ncbi:MAG TPA: MaoC family dehydratase N-terminal domain-containing protein [Actinomycetota bacterium]|nr:MaoC family dehydratase N-terminal domain-containing protein [Actinomycetota bacterium]
MVLNEALVGRRYVGDDYEVTAEAIGRYADATNDLNPRYRKPDPPASPVFAIVPAFGVIMGAARDPELGADLLRLVHITEEHVVHTPLRAGQRLSVSAKLASVAEDEGGESFSIEVELAAGAGLRRSGGRGRPQSCSASALCASTRTNRGVTRKRPAITTRSISTRRRPAPPSSPG